MSTKNIVFIDSQVSGFEKLLASLAPDTNWFLLDAEQDGVHQMQRVLANYAELDSIHVVSHGAAGALFLGSAVLTANNLNDYTPQLQSIGSSLTETGDILLYGCDVAQGDHGDSFINDMAQITGTDVAASSDTTGPRALGGDGVLESETGFIEADILATDSYTNMGNTLEAIGLSTTALVTNASVNAAPSFAPDIPGTGRVIIPMESFIGSTITLQADGKILVAGSGYNYPSYDFSLIRLNPNGSLDTTFDEDGKASIPVGGFNDYGRTIALQADGKILVAGSSSNGFMTDDFSLIRLNANGSLNRPGF